MKFYRDKFIWKYGGKIINNKLTAIYFTEVYIEFFKNGKNHNIKNAAFIRHDGDKQFCLNDKLYGNEFNFTKKSWRKFVKLQVFI
jgi:hypothetical protein